MPEGHAIIRTDSSAFLDNVVFMNDCNIDMIFVCNKHNLWNWKLNSLCPSFQAHPFKSTFQNHPKYLPCHRFVCLSMPFLFTTSWVARRCPGLNNSPAPSCLFPPLPPRLPHASPRLPPPLLLPHRPTSPAGAPSTTCPDQPPPPRPTPPHGPPQFLTPPRPVRPRPTCKFSALYLEVHCANALRQTETETDRQTILFIDLLCNFFLTVSIS